jgi:hypothetical protein
VPPFADANVGVTAINPMIASDTTKRRIKPRRRYMTSSKYRIN